MAVLRKGYRVLSISGSEGVYKTSLASDAGDVVDADVSMTISRSGPGIMDGMVIFSAKGTALMTRSGKCPVSASFHLPSCTFMDPSLARRPWDWSIINEEAAEAVAASCLARLLKAPLAADDPAKWRGSAPTSADSRLSLLHDLAGGKAVDLRSEPFPENAIVLAGVRERDVMFMERAVGRGFENGSGVRLIRADKMPMPPDLRVEDSRITAENLLAAGGERAALITPEIGAALRAMSRSFRVRPTDVDYYSGADLSGREGAETILSDRLQACELYSVIATRISRSQAAREAIDKRQPLGPVLSEEMGLSKAALKRVSKIRSDERGEPAFRSRAEASGADVLGRVTSRAWFIDARADEGRIMPIVAAMQPDWIPDDEVGWKAMVDVLSAAVIPLADELRRDPIELCASAKGRWTEWRESLARAAGAEPDIVDRAALARFMMDALDAVSHLSRSVVIPVALKAASRGQDPSFGPEETLFRRGFESAMEMVTGRAKNPLGALLEFSRRYLTRSAALGSIDSDPVATANVERRRALGVEMLGIDQFPVILPQPYTTSEGYVISQIRNMAALQREGDTKKHCVGLYHLSPAIRAESHYFSVSAPGGSITNSSTIRMVGIRKGDISVTIGEHSGYRNAAGTPEQKAAGIEMAMACFPPERVRELGEKLDIWRAELRDAAAEEQANEVQRGGHGPNWRAKRRVEQAASAPEDRWKNTLGVGDALSADRLAKAWAEWRGVVGGGFDADSPEVVYRTEAARDLVRMMNPDVAREMREAAEAAAAARSAAKREEATP